MLESQVSKVSTDASETSDPLSGIQNSDITCDETNDKPFRDCFCDHENDLQTQGPRLVRFTPVAVPPTLPSEGFRVETCSSAFDGFTPMNNAMQMQMRPPLNLKGLSLLVVLKMRGTAAIHILFEVRFCDIGTLMHDFLCFVRGLSQAGSG